MTILRRKPKFEVYDTKTKSIRPHRTEQHAKDEAEALNYGELFRWLLSFKDPDLDPQYEIRYEVRRTDN